MGSGPSPVVCQDCRRELKTAESRRRGRGPDCYEQRYPTRPRVRRRAKATPQRERDLLDLIRDTDGDTTDADH